MQLPRAFTRSLLTSVVIALSVWILNPDAADATTKKSTSYHPQTGHLIFSPANLRFGSVDAGAQTAQTVTITNASNSEITLLEAIEQGADFTLRGVDFPMTLAGGGSFTFGVVFAPRAPGESSGSLSFVAAGAGGSERLPMTGRATEGRQPGVKAAGLNFGVVAVGSAASQRGTLVAGGKAITITAAMSGDAQFTVSGLLFPFTIPAGGSQEFGVTFAPRTEGAASVTLSFMDASGTKAVGTESLNGVGAIAQGHKVDLSWHASHSKGVIGYNIYRGTKAGGPYGKINSGLDKTTCYTDATVVDGAVYYYVTTAVNAHHRESAYSNLARAKIP